MNYKPSKTQNAGTQIKAGIILLLLFLGLKFICNGQSDSLSLIAQAKKQYTKAYKLRPKTPAVLLHLDSSQIYIDSLEAIYDTSTQDYMLYKQFYLFGSVGIRQMHHGVNLTTLHTLSHDSLLIWQLYFQSIVNHSTALYAKYYPSGTLANCKTTQSYIRLLAKIEELLN
jgi:hypothetical protein